ncbi:hypothetical protein HPB49_003672 [Dermacentor silvarum]|uniref:Uncharacterized protein n=1 Tax=Dermacentor silvarum TaxID=543639 RepID=A0ACB8DTN2_DERSI|nr:hypothetical protein HPB49_003672 [Dermacentor silvarum]
MPPLPQDNIKIVLRPKGSLNLQKIGSTSVSKALKAAVELNPENTAQDNICPNNTRNIMVASTPFQENADKYADPDSTECRGCGFPNPTSSHVCDPKCKRCRSLHATADKVCKNSYLIPYVVRARRQRARLEQQDKAQLVEEEKQHAERGRSTSKTPERSRSRSRSRSRTPARTSRSRSRSQLRFGGKNNGGDGTWADKVRGATTTTPKESESRNPDKERIAMLEELRELKAAYTKLTLELTEIRKANNRRPTRTAEPPTDIETPQPVESARQGEQREECPPPKKRVVSNREWPGDETLRTPWTP